MGAQARLEQSSLQSAKISAFRQNQHKTSTLGDLYFMLCYLAVWLLIITSVVMFWLSIRGMLSQP